MAAVADRSPPRRSRRGSQLSEVSTAGETDEDLSVSPRAVVRRAGTGDAARGDRKRRNRSARRRRPRAGSASRSKPRASGDDGAGGANGAGHTTGTDTVDESFESSRDSVSGQRAPGDGGPPPLSSTARAGVTSRSVSSRASSRRGSGSTSYRGGSARRRLRLKCHYKGHIRVVAVSAKETSFRSLLQRLSADYGFDVSLKYEDADSDLITLASQNDLNELLSHESGTVTVHVSEVSPVDVSRVLQSPTPAASRSSAHLHPLEEMPAPPSAAAIPVARNAPGSARLSRNDRHMHLTPLSRSRAETPAPQTKAIRWQRGQIIGQGAYGTVYLGLNLDTGELMAIKQLDTNQLSKKEMMALENEVNMMRGLYHENIVRYLGTDRADDTLSIFMEYVPGGSIRQLLERFGQFDESVIRVYSRQLLLGLEVLHRNGIAHRDIKGANVLVANDGTIKLADFGASKRMGNASLTQTGVKGTPQWMAPEVIREQQESKGWKKADVWSVGCTVIEMATGKPPWSQYSNPVTAMYHIACKDTLPDFPSSLSEAAQEFLTLCFQRDPTKRPDVTSLLLHPFVTSLPPCNVRHLGSAMYPAGRPATAGHGERPTFGSRGSPFYPLAATPTPASSIFTAAERVEMAAELAAEKQARANGADGGAAEQDRWKNAEVLNSLRLSTARSTLSERRPSVPFVPTGPPHRRVSNASTEGGIAAAGATHHRVSLGHADAGAGAGGGAAGAAGGAARPPTFSAQTVQAIKIAPDAVPGKPAVGHGALPMVMNDSGRATGDGPAYASQILAPGFHSLRLIDQSGASDASATPDPAKSRVDQYPSRIPRRRPGRGGRAMGSARSRTSSAAGSAAGAGASVGGNQPARRRRSSRDAQPTGRSVTQTPVRIGSDRSMSAAAAGNGQPQDESAPGSARSGADPPPVPPLKLNEPGGPRSSRHRSAPRSRKIASADRAAAGGAVASAAGGPEAAAVAGGGDPVSVAVGPVPMSAERPGFSTPIVTGSHGRSSAAGGARGPRSQRGASEDGHPGTPNSSDSRATRHSALGGSASPIAVPALTLAQVVAADASSAGASTGRPDASAAATKPAQVGDNEPFQFSISARPTPSRQLQPSDSDSDGTPSPKRRLSPTAPAGGAARRVDSPRHDRLRLSTVLDGPAGLLRAQLPRSPMATQSQRALPGSPRTSEAAADAEVAAAASGANVAPARSRSPSGTTAAVQPRRTGSPAFKKGRGTAAARTQQRRARVNSATPLRTKPVSRTPNTHRRVASRLGSAQRSPMRASSAAAGRTPSKRIGSGPRTRVQRALAASPKPTMKTDTGSGPASARKVRRGGSSRDLRRTAITGGSDSDGDDDEPSGGSKGRSAATGAVPGSPASGTGSRSSGTGSGTRDRVARLRVHRRNNSGSTAEVDYEDIDSPGGDDGIMFGRTGGGPGSSPRARNLAEHLAETVGVGPRGHHMHSEPEVEERITSAVPGGGRDEGLDAAAAEVVEERLNTTVWRNGHGGDGDAASINDGDMTSVITSVVGEGGATYSSRMTLKAAHTLVGHTAAVTCAQLQDMVARQSAFHLGADARHGSSGSMSATTGHSTGKPPAGDEESFGVAAGVAASGALDGTVRVWDVAHGRVLALVRHVDSDDKTRSRGRRRTRTSPRAGSVDGRPGTGAGGVDGGSGRAGADVGGSSRVGSLETSADFGLHVAHVPTRSPTSTSRRSMMPRPSSGMSSHSRKVVTPGTGSSVSHDPAAEMSAPAETGGAGAGVGGSGGSAPSPVANTVAVTAMAILPRTSILVTGTDDGRVWAWDTASNERLRRLRGHTGSVRCIAFHTDAMVGKALGAPSVRAFSRARSRGRHSRKRRSKTKTLAGVRVASGSQDQTVRVWDLSQRRQCLMHVLRGHTGPIHSLVFVPGTWLVASCAADSTVRVWDIRTGRRKLVLQEHYGAVMCMVTVPGNTMGADGGSPVARRDAAGSAADGPSSPAAEARKRSPERGGGASGGSTVGMSVGGVGGVATSRLGIGYGGDTSPRGGLDSAASVGSSASQPHRADGVQVNSASSWQGGGATAGLLSGARDGSIKLWDLRTGKCVRTLRGHGRAVMALRLPPNPSSVPRGSFFTFMGTMGGVGGSAGGGSRNNSPRRMSTATIQTHLSHATGPVGAARSFGSQMGGAADGGGSGGGGGGGGGSSGVMKAMGTGGGMTVMAGSFKLGVDGSVVSGSDGFTPRSGVSASSQSPRTAPHHVGHVMSCSADGTLRLWNYRTGRALRMFEGHRGAVTCMEWGMYNIAVSGGVDGSLRVWNVNTGVCVHVVQHPDSEQGASPSSAVARIAWKGEWLLGAFKDGALRVWRWVPTES